MDTVLSLMVAAALALMAGAVALWRRTGNRKQALLMVLLAVIALVNVGIWTIPDGSGDAPLAKIRQGTDQGATDQSGRTHRTAPS